MSDKSLLAVVTVSGMAMCCLLEIIGVHVNPGPCYISAMTAGALAALMWAGRDDKGRRDGGSEGKADPPLASPDPPHPDSPIVYKSEFMRRRFGET